MINHFKSNIMMHNKAEWAHLGAFGKSWLITVSNVDWKTSDMKFIIEMLWELQHMDTSHSLNYQFSNNFM